MCSSLHNDNVLWFVYTNGNNSTGEETAKSKLPIDSRFYDTYTYTTLIMFLKKTWIPRNLNDVLQYQPKSFASMAHFFPPSKKKTNEFICFEVTIQG